jgi:mannobiose 2-epimerase
MVRSADLRGAIESELLENLLPFWRERRVDHELGGFIGEMANDGTVRTGAPRGLILNARILWSFAAVHRTFGQEIDLSLAARAFEYLMTHFRDAEHGGFHWLLDAAGSFLDDSKKIYGQAFCIYALSEYHLATGDAGALAEARRIFELVEEHAYDEAHDGYIEVVAADWTPTTDLRLSDKDMNVAKSMNNHLHVLEAYTNLYRAWPHERLAARLRELIACFEHHVVDRASGRCHLRHFFDERWNVCSDSYTYGHDIEAAWLLCETAEVLGDEGLLTAVEGLATELAWSALREGLDDAGGLAYEGQDGEVIDPNRDWWCQAEAVVGFWQAYSLTGEEAFAVASERVWRFIERHVVDHDHGEWFWRILADGSVDPREPKVSEWKGPYHNMRMGLEMLRRIDNRGSR